MKELLTVFLIGMACGYVMYCMLAARRPGYKGAYALYLMAINGAVMAFAFSFKSLFALGLVLIAYTILLALTDAAPPSVFCLPAVWLAAIGNFFIGNRVAHGTFNWTDCLIFELVAFLAVLYPFMTRIQTSLDGKEIDVEDEDAQENFTIRKHKNFAWTGVIGGFIVAIVLVYVH